MAKRTIYVLTDDLDGGEAHETVTFALDGTTYSIDLSREHAAKMRAALMPFATMAHRQPRVTAARTTTPNPDVVSYTQSLSDQAAEQRRIRAWAASQGLRVANRGRIAQSVVAAYQAANG